MVEIGWRNVRSFDGKPPPRPARSHRRPSSRRTAIAGPELAEAAQQDRLGFWADQARGLLAWQKPFTEVLDWTNPPFARWFADGTLNVAYNCLDRHVEEGNGDRVAFHWEGEPGDTAR